MEELAPSAESAGGPHDLKRRHASLYRASAAPAVVAVPPLRFLMLDGTGGLVGEASAYAESAQALLTLAYQVKFAARKRLDLSYPVMPLEAMYWDAAGGQGTRAGDPGSTAWRLLILLPDEITAEFVEEVRESAAEKKAMPRMRDVRVQTFSEGTSVQVMYAGSGEDKASAIESLRGFAKERGFAVTGSLHEIHLNDPERTSPEKLKTILRYGVTAQPQSQRPARSATKVKKPPHARGCRDTCARKRR